jgi:hypothetical protein
MVNCSIYPLKSYWLPASLVDQHHTDLKLRIITSAGGIALVMWLNYPILKFYPNQITNPFVFL